MSEFESTVCEDLVLCPYCGHDNEEAGMDGGGEHNQECDKCGKMFHVLSEVVYQYSMDPDCLLNDTAHDNEAVTHNGDWVKCRVCGQIGRK